MSSVKIFQIDDSISLKFRDIRVQAKSEQPPDEKKNLIYIYITANV